MRKIFLVDDEPHILRITRLSLERAGYSVSSAVNGEEALGLFDAEQPDVMITDIDMPRMNGRELCESIDARYPGRDFRIYVLTSRAEIEHRDWTSRMENLSFLEKPVSVQALLSDLDGYFSEREGTG